MSSSEGVGLRGPCTEGGGHYGQGSLYGEVQGIICNGTPCGQTNTTENNWQIVISKPRAFDTVIVFYERHICCLPNLPYFSYFDMLFTKLRESCSNVCSITGAKLFKNRCTRTRPGLIKDCTTF